MTWWEVSHVVCDRGAGVHDGGGSGPCDWATIGGVLNGASWSVDFVPSKYRWAGAPFGSGYQPDGGGGGGAVTNVRLEVILCVGQYACSLLGPPLNTEFLVNLRPVLGTVQGEDNPVVNLAVGQHEVDRGPYRSGFLLEDKHVG